MNLKAVAHVHSEWSYDGIWDLSRIAVFFGALGYDVVLMTEHDRTFDEKRWQDYQSACRKASTGKTLIVPGIEYSDADNTVHILVWGVSGFLGKGNKTGILLQKANERNGVCVLAHPGRRNAWKQIDKSWINLLHGIEIWNRKFDGITPGPQAMQLLRSNHKALPFAGLDFHQTNQIFPLSMQIEVADALSEQTVLHALKKSQCRPIAFGISATQFTRGPLLSISKIADRSRRMLAKLIKRK